MISDLTDKILLSFSIIELLLLKMAGVALGQVGDHRPTVNSFTCLYILSLRWAYLCAVISPGGIILQKEMTCQLESGLNGERGLKACE